MACCAYGQVDTASALPPRAYAGAYGWLGTAPQLTNLAIPGYLPDCGVLRSGTAFIWGGGLLYELPLSPALALQFRGGVAGADGQISERVSDPLRLDDGTVTQAQADQVVEFRHLDLEIAARARLALTGRLHLVGGLTAGHALASEETHKQVAVEPSQLLFSNGRRVLVLESGRLYAPSALLAAIEAGAAYDLPISRTGTLSPELSLGFPVTSHTSAGAWRSLSLRAGASLRFGLPAQEPPVVVPPRIDTPVAPQRSPTIVLSVGTLPMEVKVRIDEYDSIEVLPLLNQIFFAETSAELRREYVRMTPSETESFTNAQLTGSALDVYYQLLNIVGRRMREFPRATLTINGYRNGRESDPGLSARRADAAKRYLTDIWKIGERRVRVAGNALPPNPSRETSREGFEENARLELVPSDPNILAPILRRHVQRVATPPALTFYLQALAEAGVASWRLETEEQGTGVWRSFSGYGTPPDSILWDWRSDRGELPALPVQLRYKFTVTDSSGRSTTTNLADIDVTYQSVKKKLENRQNDTTIENYSILLFNYDSPRISQGDQDLLRVIAGTIKNRAAVKLVGYTDSLGDERHNLELATARAREVERLFNRLLPRDASVDVDEASGGERERFPYSTPEGRSHCRTVVIEVRTPTREGGS